MDTTSEHDRAGMMPGSIVYTGTKKVETVTISVFRYNERECLEERAVSLARALELHDETSVTWINIDGLHDTDLIQSVGEHFGLHPLVLEDIVTTGQRPKIETYPDYLYISLRMLEQKSSKAGFVNDQLSLVLAPNLVLTFQEYPGDVFDPVRERIRNKVGRIRRLGADYLAYALVDMLVDTYFVILEEYSEVAEVLEDELLADPSPAALQKVTSLKRELLFLRKAVWPLRELLSSLQRDESVLISAEVQTFLRDVYDHAIQVIDTVETLRDILSGLHDFYLSSVSFRMNEVMQVLTIVGAIFIPLSFLAGVFGMNFDEMAGLHWRYGYPMFWLITIVIVSGQIWFFRSRKWL